MAAGRPDRSGGPSALDDAGVTRREAEVLDALAERLTNSEIAARLYVSERTVESHVSALLRKLGKSNRLELGELAKSLRSADSAEVRRLPPALELAVEAGFLTGRAVELDVLRDMWRDASGGRVLLAVVAGDAGIGKTRLVAELARGVHEDGGLVLAGSCHEDLPAPFGPFVEAIEASAGAVAPADVARWVGPLLPALVQLSPPLADALELVADTEAPVERDEIYGAVHRFLAGSAESHPALLVLEDIHWASESTLGLIRHLVRVGGHSPVLLVATARDTPPDRGAALEAFLGDVARLPGARIVPLAGLTPSEVDEMLVQLGSTADAASVVAESGGNPLFIHELAMGGPRPGVSPTASLVSTRESLLSDSDRELLDLAAVVGARFGADVLAQASGRDLVAVLESLERAEAAGLVVAHPGRPGLFEHRHALFRSARYGGLADARRIRLHAEVVRTLEPRSADRRAAVQLARHACMAAALLGAEDAIGHVRHAARLAESAAAFGDAAALYRQALDVVELLAPADLAARVELTISWGRALNRQGDPRHRRVLLEAAELATSLGDHGSLAEIVWAMSQEGTPFDPGRPDPQLAEIAEAAIGRLEPGSVAHAKLLAGMAADRWLGGDKRRGRELAEQAITSAQEHDALLLGQVLLHTVTVRWAPGSPSNRSTADELVTLGRRHGNRSVVAHGMTERALASIEHGDPRALECDLAALGEALESAGMPFNHIWVQFQGLTATLRIWRGELDAAEEQLDQLADLVAHSGRHPALLTGPAIVVIRHNQGRLAERLAPMEAFLAEDRPGFRDYSSALLALAFCHAGRPHDAGERLWELLDGDEPAVPDPFWLCGRVMLAEVAEMMDDRRAGSVLLSELAPHAGLVATTFQVGLSPVDLALAQAALAAGDLDKAETAARRLVEGARAKGMPIFRARGLLRVAAVDLQRDGAPQVSAAVDEALAIADATGAELIEQEAVRLGLIV